MWFSSSSAKKSSASTANGSHHRRPATALLVPSSPTQRNRPNVRNGSIGNGSSSHSIPPLSPTSSRIHHPSARDLFGIRRSKSSSSSSFHRKAPWSVTACTNLVLCFLITLLSLTLMVNLYHPSLMQPDLILEPEEPPEFQQLQQERFEEDLEREGIPPDAILPPDLGVVVQPHLGPLPDRQQELLLQQQRRRRRQRRRKNGLQQEGQEQQPPDQADQEQLPPEQQQQQMFQRRRGRFRGQQAEFNAQEQPLRGMMMMMQFKAVEKHDNQLLKRNKFGQVVFRPVTNVSQGDLELDDRFLPDEVDANLEEAEARAQRKELLDILNEAGVKSLDLPTILSLPTTEQLIQLYGEGPVIFGEDSCATFQSNVPSWDASLGVAGLFNTGTNPLAMYLEANCMIEANRQRNRGMRWQVPWGKHMMASRKWTNTAQNDYTVNKKHVMPVVMIRDPYMWMQSLCKHPYATKWYRSKAHCPSLVPTLYDRFLFPWIRAETLVVRVWKGTTWPSLAHLWTDWYQQYYRADYPRLIVRFEDMIYHPRKTVERICKCVGGVIRADKDGTPFTYVVDSGKWGPAHGGKRTNLVSAMIKYGTDKKRFHNLTQADLQLAFDALDPEMMQIFQYQVSAPPS